MYSKTILQIVLFSERTREDILNILDINNNTLPGLISIEFNVLLTTQDSEHVDVILHIDESISIPQIADLLIDIGYKIGINNL